MSIKNILHTYQLPDCRRILIIDDKIATNIAYKNCFETCVKQALINENLSFNVELDFSHSIDDGFDNWRNNSYDLILLDYDFTKTVEENDKFRLSSIFPDRSGAGLFTFIQQLKKISDYEYKAFQKILIWTSHRWNKEENGAEIGVARDLKDYEEFVKKKTDYNLNNLVDDLKGINCENWTLEYVLERLVSLSLSNKYNLTGHVAFAEKKETGNIIYPPLVEQILDLNGSEGYLYLVPYQSSYKFKYFCSVDKLQIIKKIKKRLNGNDFKDILIGHKKEKDFPKNEIHNICSIDKATNDIKKAQKEYVFFMENLDKNIFDKEENYHFAGINLDSKIWLASTPLTMVTRVGIDDDVFSLLINKLDAFFNIGVGAAVLKTTYLESNDIEWALDHSQRYHRTRVFNPSYNFIDKNELINHSVSLTKDKEDIGVSLKDVRIKHPVIDQLWNTGSTALEAFPPNMLNAFLKETKKNKKENWTRRIIVSVGTKSIDTSAWDMLFDIIFNGIEKDLFPLVEINTRHFLRPLLKKHLGGDEYLSPNDSNMTKIIEKIENYPILVKEYTDLIKYIHSLGKKHSKKIILKYPFRSDILVFLKIAEEIAGFKERDAKDHCGISGITLINTSKSPYHLSPNTRSNDPSQHDEVKMPQMSGELLAWMRNYLLCKLEESGFTLPISVSGGVGINENDVGYLQSKSIVKSIQIGTYFIKKIDAERIKALKINNKKGLEVKNKNLLGIRMVHFSPQNCINSRGGVGRCGACYNSYYCDVFLNRGVKEDIPLMDLTACTGCGLCVENCPTKALNMKSPKEYLILCSPPSESRARILRESDIPFINMDIPQELPTDKVNIWEEWLKNKFSWLKGVEFNYREKINDESDIESKAIREAYIRAFTIYHQCHKPAPPKSKEKIPLEDSMFLGIKTYVLGGDDIPLNVAVTENDVEGYLKGHNEFSAITAYVLIKANGDVTIKLVRTDRLKLKEEINTNSEKIKLYLSHGIGKAGGIDILNYGDILFENSSINNLKEVYAFAGLPLEALDDMLS